MPTIEEVITRLTEQVYVEDTVDGLKMGGATSPVHGIGSTFMASYDVLKRAQRRGLNLVLTHESPFYSHRDQIDILEGDAVYQAKLAFLAQSEIAVFRLHDHIHRITPDGIVDGLIRDLEWTAYIDANKVQIKMDLKTPVLTIPTMRLGEVAQYVKTKLQVNFVRIVGDRTMPCQRIGLLPGYCGGGRLAIPFMRSEALDLIIAGEGPEWETPEYVRDAISLGQAKAMMILGHRESEESGMKYLLDWLQPLFPEVPMEFLPAKPLFEVI